MGWGFWTKGRKLSFCTPPPSHYVGLEPGYVVEICLFLCAPPALTTHICSPSFSPPACGCHTWGPTPCVFTVEGESKRGSRCGCLTVGFRLRPELRDSTGNASRLGRDVRLSRCHQGTPELCAAANCKGLGNSGRSLMGPGIQQPLSLSSARMDEKPGYNLEHRAGGFPVRWNVVDVGAYITTSMPPLLVWPRKAPSI